MSKLFIGFFSFLFFLRPDFLHCNIQHILLKVQHQVQLLRAGSYKGGVLQSGPLGSSPGSLQTTWFQGSHCYCLCSVMLYKDGVGEMTSVVSFSSAILTLKPKEVRSIITPSCTQGDRVSR